MKSSKVPVGVLCRVTRFGRGFGVILVSRMVHASGLSVGVRVKVFFRFINDGDFVLVSVKPRKLLRLGTGSFGLMVDNSDFNKDLFRSGRCFSVFVEVVD